MIDASAPLEVTSDNTRVKQIVKNLVANALKFTDAGSVTVRLSGAGGIDGAPGDRYLAIAVADTGIGIDAQDHNLIFESFQQAARGSTRKYGAQASGWRSAVNWPANSAGRSREQRSRTRLHVHLLPARA